MWNHDHFDCYHTQRNLFLFLTLYPRFMSLSLCQQKLNTQLHWAARKLNLLDLNRWLLTISDSYFPAADVGLTGLPGNLGVSGAAPCRAWFNLTDPPSLTPTTSSLKFHARWAWRPGNSGVLLHSGHKKAFRKHSCQAKATAPLLGNKWDIFTGKVLLWYLGHCFSTVGSERSCCDCQPCHATTVLFWKPVKESKQKASCEIQPISGKENKSSRTKRLHLEQEVMSKANYMFMLVCVNVLLLTQHCGG